MGDILKRKAGLPHELSRTSGLGAATTAGGGILGKLLCASSVGRGAAIPTQAAQVSPSDLSTQAPSAQQQDDSIVDRLGSFYAQHPTLCETLGVAARFNVNMSRYHPLPILCCVVVSACAPSTHVLVGQARAPITRDQVKIYSHPPEMPFEEIAVLDATSNSAFGTGGQKSIDKVIERLMIEAANLGANGFILEGFSDAETGSIGTGMGSDSYGGHSAVVVGVGGSFGISKKTGHGDAIYVPASTN